jgi:hypothetical protein
MRNSNLPITSGLRLSRYIRKAVAKPRNKRPKRAKPQPKAPPVVPFFWLGAEGRDAGGSNEA